MAWLRWLVAVLSLRRPGFDPEPVCGFFGRQSYSGLSISLNSSAFSS